MFALANVMHLLPHEFPGLRGRRLSLARILARSLNGFLFRHDLLL
jgi:hypothetical protein